jgi:aminoglycoside phosphotransferase family enzyme/predicted kinase
VDALVDAFGLHGPAHGRPAALAETHVSVVIFIGDRAYKLKKPLRTAFLDYSTRAAREAVCHREVVLNRRLAPDVYLGVVDLVGPDGHPFDHMVVMRRMPDGQRLSTLVQNDTVSDDQLRAIARTMAAFHATATRGAHIDAAATPAAVRDLWTRNFAEMVAFVPSILDRDLLAAVEDLALTYLDGRERLLVERIERGRVVDGQGDLLAGDVFCLNDGPRILDCLEFDDALRFGDVLLDMAFLAMDLDRLGRPDLARRLLDAYREFTAESHPRSLEHHYIAYRALVRSKVACLLATDGHPEAKVEARSLLELAAQHLRQGRIQLVLVGGTPGTGKSTLADAIGRRLGWTVARSDEVRKERAGISSLERAGAPFGEGIYDATSTAATYAEMLRRAEIAIAYGESIVLDATWSSEALRVRAREVAGAGRAEIIELCCDCPPRVADARLAARMIGGRDASDADVAIAARVRSRFDAWPGAHTIGTASDPEVSSSEALGHVDAETVAPTDPDV